jgi:hypothetical protein
MAASRRLIRLRQTVNAILATWTSICGLDAALQPRPVSNRLLQ